MAEIVTDNNVDDCPLLKKAKIDNNDTSEKIKNIHENEVSLPVFNLNKILQTNCMRKQICLEGSFEGYDGTAVMILEKQNFADDQKVLKEFFGKDTVFQKLYSNTIYGNYECFPAKKYSGINAMVIHPATQKHIEKFTKKELYMVDETYELYQKVTVPYIESSSFSTDWIHNILEHKAEQDKIVYEDRNEKTGFVLVNDLKWDGQLNTLKLIALPLQKIKSIRELNASHLPLLKNIRDAGIAAIAKKFNLSASQLRIYLHYQPSYYYLHVHFAYLMYEAPGIFVEKAHLLSVVISNLELISDYYKKTVLSYVVAEGDPLYIKFKEEGVLTEVKSKTNEVEK